MAEFFWAPTHDEIVIDGVGKKITVKFYFRQEQGERHATRIYLSLPSALTASKITALTEEGTLKFTSAKDFTGKPALEATPVWDTMDTNVSLLFADIPAGQLPGEHNQRHAAILGWSIELMAGDTDKMHGHQVKAWAIGQTSTKPTANIVQKFSIIPTLVELKSVELTGDVGKYFYDTTSSLAPLTWLSKGSKVTISGKTTGALKHAFVSLKLDSDTEWRKPALAVVNVDTKSFSLTDAFDLKLLSAKKKVKIQVRVCQVYDDTRATGSGWSSPQTLTVCLDDTEPKSTRVETVFSADILTLYAQFTDTESGISKVEYWTVDMEPEAWVEITNAAHTIDIPNSANLTQGIKVRATDKVGHTVSLVAFIDPHVVDVSLKTSSHDIRQDPWGQAELLMIPSVGFSLPNLDFELIPPNRLLHFSPSHIQDALNSEPWISFSFDNPTLYGQKVTGLQYKIEKSGFYKDGLYDVIIVPEDTIYAPPIPDFDLDRKNITARSNDVVLSGRFMSPPVTWAGHPIEFQYSVGKADFSPVSEAHWTPGDYAFWVKLPADNFVKEQAYGVSLLAKYKGDDLSDSVVSTVTINAQAALLQDIVLAAASHQLTASGSVTPPTGSPMSDVKVAINWTGQGDLQSTDWQAPDGNGNFKIQTPMSKVLGAVNPILYTKVKDLSALIGHAPFPNSTGLVEVQCKVDNSTAVFTAPKEGSKGNDVDIQALAPIEIKADTQFTVVFTVTANVGIRFMNCELFSGANIGTVAVGQAVPNDSNTTGMKSWNGVQNREVFGFEHLPANKSYTATFQFKATTVGETALTFKLSDPEDGEATGRTTFNKTTNYVVRLNVLPKS